MLNDSSAISPAMSSSGPSTTPSIVRVLLVEDEPKLRESLLEGLRLEDWAVTGAASGSEALREIEAQPFDLVVLDWMLPDRDGLDILRQLRASGCRVPVLLITARGGSNRDMAFQSGASAFLTKPFAFDELLDCARRLLKLAA